MTTNWIFSIRRATQADAGAIAAVHLLSHRETYIPLVGIAEYWPMDPLQHLKEWQEVLKRDDIVLVAETGGQVVGFAHAMGDKIDTLYILPSWHRRGVGRALLTELRRSLAARSIAVARFAVLAVNKKAIRFYETLGARATGNIVVEERGLRYEDRLFEIVTSV